jgi:hypothetical protein
LESGHTNMGPCMVIVADDHPGRHG